MTSSVCHSEHRFSNVKLVCPDCRQAGDRHESITLGVHTVSDGFGFFLPATLRSES